MRIFLSASTSALYQFKHPQITQAVKKGWGWASPQTPMGTHVAPYLLRVAQPREVKKDGNKKVRGEGNTHRLGHSNLAALSTIKRGIYTSTNNNQVYISNYRSTFYIIKLSLTSKYSRNNTNNSIFPLFSHDLHNSSTTKVIAILQNAKNK